MSETIAGATLSAGMGVVAVAGSIGSWAGGKVGSPADDWFYDLIGWLAIGGVIAGIAMFFVGAMVFARK